MYGTISQDADRLPLQPGQAADRGRRRAAVGGAAVDERRPVVGRQRALHEEHAAHHALVVELELRDRRLERKRGRHALELDERRGRDHVVVSLAPAVGEPHPHPVAVALDPLDARRRADRGAALAQAPLERVDQRPVAMPETALHLGPHVLLAMHAARHPQRGQRGVGVADLRREQRLPQDLERALPGHAAQPVGGGHAVQLGAHAAGARAQADQPHAHALGQRQRREPQQVPRGVHGIHAAAVHESHARAAPHQLGFQPQLADVPQQRGVAPQDAVVEALEVEAAVGERGTEAAEEALALVERHAVPELRDPDGARQTRNAATDDRCAVRHATSNRPDGGADAPLSRLKLQ